MKMVSDGINLKTKNKILQMLIHVMFNDYMKQKNL